MSESEGKGTAAFVLGLLGLLGILPCIGSILGIVLGKGQDNGLARAGVIMGWIGLGLLALAVLAFAGMAILGVGFAAFEAR